MYTLLGFRSGVLDISLLRQIGCLSGRVECFHWALSKKNHQPLQAAASGAYSHLAQDVSFTMHRAQSPGDDPMARHRPPREGYRPLLGNQDRYSANNWQKMPIHNRYSDSQHIHARLYPWGIQRMAHKHGGLTLWDSIQLQSEGYRQQ